MCSRTKNSEILKQIRKGMYQISVRRKKGNLFMYSLKVSLKMNRNTKQARAIKKS